MFDVRKDSIDVHSQNYECEEIITIESFLNVHNSTTTDRDNIYVRMTVHL